jgi:hypothetical protein
MMCVQFGAALAAYAIKGAMAGSQVRQIKGKHGSSKYSKNYTAKNYSITAY